MSIVVQKYGGTSVGDTDRMKRVADRVSRTHRDGNQTVVVVSAMGKTTDDLVAMAQRISDSPAAARARHPAHLRRAHLDVAAGHGARRTRACPPSRSPGSQAGIITDAVHGKARILEITPGPRAGGARRGQRRHRRRLPGRQPGHQGHHHPRSRRVGHDRRGARRRARRRRLRDLHRRRRGLHRRPPHRAVRPQARLPLLRGGARADRARRRRPAGPVGRVRPQPRRADPRPLVVQLHARHVGRASRGVHRGGRHHLRCRARHLRGQGHRQQGVRPARHRRQAVLDAGRRQHQHRHDRPERRRPTGAPTSPSPCPAATPTRRAPSSSRSPRRSAPRASSSTRTSRRSRSSAPG